VSFKFRFYNILLHDTHTHIKLEVTYFFKLKRSKIILDTYLGTIDTEGYFWEENIIDPIIHVIDVQGKGVKRLKGFSPNHRAKILLKKRWGKESTSYL